MCHFVTMVLPPKADIDQVKQVLGRYRRGFEIVENRHVARVLEPREVYFHPSSKQCDCGTALGSMSREPDGPNAADLAREIEKRERKGWNAGKIARWREQLEKNRRTKTEQAQSQIDSAGEPDDWLNIVRDLRADARLPYVGLLLHFYGGALSEHIDTTRKALPLDDRAAAALYRMDEDTLYILS